MKTPASAPTKSRTNAPAATTRSLSTRLALLMTIPMVGLLFFGLRSTHEKWQTYRAIVTLEKNSAVLQQIGHVVHELQKERGRSAGFLGSKGQQFSAELRQQREETDAKLTRLHELLATFDAAQFGPAFGARLQRSRDLLGEVAVRRDAINRLALAPTESTAFYSGVIAAQLDVVVAMSHLSNDAEIANGIFCYVNYLQAKEQAGIERATLSGAFSANAFTSESARAFSRISATQDTYLRVFDSFASDKQRRFLAEKVTGPAIEAVARMRQVAIDKASTGNFGINAATWFDAATTRINLMKEVEDQLARDYAQLAGTGKSAARQALIAFATTTILILLVTAAFAWRMTNGISVQLLGIASTISEGSGELTSAATQVSAASQASAAGANEEAASLQQTSASLAEVAGMTQRNAAAAAEAKTLSAQTRDAADSGAREMEAMKKAMDDLKASSARIAQVVKSIDEIAFQTNILALNAAVEAARAGEAGAGFAVVAEEVRALAQRSAQAARETAQMIDESVHNSERVELTSRVGLHLSEIVAKAHQVDQLVAEITSSSAQQTQGITLVNTAVSQMDKITQSTAAGAEETAAQAEELNSQALELTKAVAELMAIVGGRRENDPVGLPGKAMPDGRRSIDRNPQGIRRGRPAAPMATKPRASTAFSRS